MVPLFDWSVTIVTRDRIIFSLFMILLLSTMVFRKNSPTISRWDTVAHTKCICIPNFNCSYVGFWYILVDMLTHSGVIEWYCMWLNWSKINLLSTYSSIDRYRSWTRPLISNTSKMLLNDNYVKGLYQCSMLYRGPMPILLYSEGMIFLWLSMHSIPLYHN